MDDLITNPKPKPLAPEMCDAHARAFMSGNQTTVRFLIKHHLTGEAALAVGSVIDIDKRGDKRLWKVSVIAVTPTGAAHAHPLPPSGAVFVIEDENLAV